jgi:hypothetical protein
MLRPTHLNRRLMDQQKPMDRILRMFLAEVEFHGGLWIPANPSVGFIVTALTGIQQTASDTGPYGRDIDMQGSPLAA